MKNKIILTTTFTLFLVITANAQLLKNVTEYRIGFNGKFLTYRIAEETPSASPVQATETITTTNPLTGKTTTINRPVASNEQKLSIPVKTIKGNNIGAMSASKLPVNYISPGADILTMELNNYANSSQFEKDKQIWIIEFVTTGTLDPYYTIKNKASGKYLTHLENEAKPTVDLRPLANSNMKSQHWYFSNLEEVSNRLPYYGKTREVGIIASELHTASFTQETIKPAMFRQDNTSNVLALDVFGSGKAYIDPYGVRKVDNRYNFFITPNIAATKVILTDILKPMCPTTVIRGDRDFNSLNAAEVVTEIVADGTVKENPLTTFEINLTISDDNKEIWANIKLNVKEQKSDRTETEGTWRIKVYTAPAGKLLDQIISDKNYRREALGTIEKHTGKNDIRYNCEFMEYCIVVGDTMGLDISDDDNCHDDTRVERIVFRPLFVTFK